MAATGDAIAGAAELHAAEAEYVRLATLHLCGTGPEAAAGSGTGAGTGLGLGRTPTGKAPCSSEQGADEKAATCLGSVHAQMNAARIELLQASAARLTTMLLPSRNAK